MTRQDRETIIVAGCLERPAWFVKNRSRIEPHMIGNHARRAIVTGVLEGAESDGTFDPEQLARYLLSHARPLDLEQELTEASGFHIFEEEIFDRAFKRLREPIERAHLAEGLRDALDHDDKREIIAAARTALDRFAL